MLKRVKNKIYKIKEKYLNYKEILEDYDITIYKGNFENVMGYTNYLQARKPIIVINDNLAEEEQTFVILHELGHILLHDETIREFSKITQTNKEEIEADLFAVIFGEYTYNESDHWLNKKINYIHCNFLTELNCCLI